jgi:hypothetical protein
MSLRSVTRHKQRKYRLYGTTLGDETTVYCHKCFCKAPEKCTHYRDGHIRRPPW